MWLKSIQIKNTKGFVDSGVIEFSEGINVLVGANNSGKSTILRSIHLLQPTDETHKFFKNSIRVGTQERETALELSAPTRERINIPSDWNIEGWKPKIVFQTSQRNAQALINFPNGNNGPISTQPICPPDEPNNFIYPYFSRRKPADFNLQITVNNARAVGDAFQHLPSKIDRLLEDPDSEIYKSFRNPDGKKLIEELRLKFKRDWPENHFKLFSADQFEKYYPKEFSKKVSEVLAMSHGLPKQDAKGELAASVVNWSLENPKEAKAEFAACAKEVLDFLAEIDKKLS